MKEKDWQVSADPAAMLKNLTMENVHFVGQFGGWVNRETPLISPRKMRLFAVAAVRIIWHPCSAGCEKANRMAERIADGEALDALEIETVANWHVLEPDPAEAFRRVLADKHEHKPQPHVELADLLRSMIGNPWKPVVLEKGPNEYRMNGIHGQGYYPTYPWLTPTVVSLAETAYRERLKVKCNNPIHIAGEGYTCALCGQSSSMYGHQQGKCPACPECGSSKPVTIGTGQLDPDRLAVLADRLEDDGCTDAAILDHLRGIFRCLDCKGEGTHQVPEYEPVRDTLCPHCGGKLQKRTDDGIKAEDKWCPECWAVIAGKCVGYKAAKCNVCKGRGFLDVPTQPRYRGDFVIDLLTGRS